MCGLLSGPMGHRQTSRSALVLLTLTMVLALTAMTSQAAAYTPGCGQIPIVNNQVPPL
jgi:hypothetical protein